MTCGCRIVGVSNGQGASQQRIEFCALHAHTNSYEQEIAMWKDAIVKIGDQKDTLAREVEWLRGALKEYGQHLTWPACNVLVRIPNQPIRPCSCGLSAALADPSGAR